MKKKRSKQRKAPAMLPEYDFSGGRRGKYATRYARGTNVVVLAPDQVRFFPDSESANNALRAFVELMEKFPGVKNTTHH